MAEIGKKTGVLVITTITLIILLNQVFNEDWNEDENDFEPLPEEVFDVRENKNATFAALLDDYKTLLSGMKKADRWETNQARRSCEDEDKNNRQVVPCIDDKCDAKVSADPESSLAGILESMTDLEEDTLAEVTRLIRAKHTHKKVLFVTAASSNHYKESQALIHNLNEFVFPLLSNYSFVYYDLGLSVEERSELEQFCGCEMRTFPLSMMPERIKPLTCYTWKPLIVHANLPKADTLIWVDSSVRFKQDALHKLLDMIEETRVIITNGIFPIAHHATVDMFNYFRESTCSFSAIPEFQATFIVFKNERLIREAVVKPWAACALSPFCMCPVDHTELLHCESRKWQYNKCHRFDQAALGIILVKLFRNHDNNIRVGENVVSLRRRHREDYFQSLKQTSNRLFRNFE